MLWLIVAIFSYFFFALATIIDRYLLKGPIPHPKIYTFYVGLLSISALFLIPLGFFIPQPKEIVLSILAGVVTIFALYVFYTALWKFEASRIIPAFGGFLPIFTLGFSSIFGAKNFLSFWQILAFLILVSGSVLITLEKKKLITFNSLLIAIFCALLFSLFFILSKLVYLQLPFWSGFIWMRIGALIAALFFLFSEQVRQELFQKRVTFRRKTAGIFIFNQGLGGGAVLLQNFAIALVPPSFLAFVNALIGIEYIFLLILVVLISLKFPQILKEEISKKILTQKILAILMIAIGIVLLAFK